MQRFFPLRSPASTKLQTALALIFAVCLLSSMDAFAFERERNAGQTSWLNLDIPAQSLASALQAYSILTGREIFYDGALVLGRRSAAVNGIFPPDAALRALLLGTDFVSRPLGSHGFTITPAPHTAIDSSGPDDALAPDRGYERYFAALQVSLRDVLCRSSETRPGSYRLLIRFWLTPSGDILRPQLISSTGDPERDRAFAAALPMINAGGPPPAGMPQPLTMIVFPRRPEEAGDCLSRHASSPAK
jgi:hypothetical protein